jgi:hypothetical protein
MAAVSVFVALTGCATIQSYENIEQPTGATLQTYINGRIFKVQRTTDLPNAFGKPDIFGGKVKRGYMELRYLGLAEDGRLILRLTDVEIESTETTMSRYGVGRTAVTSTTTSMGYNTWTTASGVYVPPPEGKTEILPPNTTEFLFNTQANPLVIGNIEVSFLEMSPYNVKYQLRKLPSP